MNSGVLSILSFFAGCFAADEFYDAIRDGDEDKVTKLLLEKEPDEPMTDPFERSSKENLPLRLVSTPLLYAIAYEKENIAKILMEKGAHLPRASESDVFYAAITYGLDSVVKLMMERGFDVTEPVPYAGILNTYLHYAVARKRAKIVKLICDDGRVNIPALDDIPDWPLLKVAIFNNSGAEISSVLLNAGADVRKMDKNLNSILHWVATMSEDRYHAILDFARSILSRGGVDIEAKDKYGFTPLMKAADFGNEGAFRALLVAGADINARNHIGQTAMHFRARRNENMVSLSKSYGLNFETENTYGNTPLLHAANVGDKTGVKLLVNAGGNVDASNTMTGKTALYFAAETRENPDMMEFLLLYGADATKMVEIPDFQSFTPKGNAARNILIEAGLVIPDEKITEILKRYHSGCYEIVRDGNFVHFDDLMSRVMKELLKNVTFDPESPDLPRLLQRYESEGAFAMYKMLKKYCGKKEQTSEMEAKKWNFFGIIIDAFTNGTYFQPVPSDIAYDVFLGNHLHAWKFERLAFNLAAMSRNVKVGEKEVGELVRKVIFSDTFAPVQRKR